MKKTKSSSGNIAALRCKYLKSLIGQTVTCWKIIREGKLVWTETFEKIL